MLVEVYGESAPTETSGRDWFQRFKIGDFSVEAKRVLANPKKKNKLWN